jgi:putative ABC transport system permease protein
MQQLFGALPGAASLGLVWGIMAIGLYITNKILDISDLTVDGSICTGAAVCTMLMMQGVNPWIAMLCSVLAGGLCGLVTGLLHTVLEIPAILSGILTQLALWSINLKIMGQANRPLSARNFPVILTQMKTTEAIITLVIIAVAIIGLLYWFFGTALGCSIRATGCNINMSRAQGINTELNKVLGLIISNGLVALSGALLAQYQGFADINMGRGAIVIGLAAIVIGDVLFSKIARNFAVRLCGVLAGGVIYYVVYQVIVFIGLDPDLLKMLSAVVVAVFLGVPNIKNKLFAKLNRRKNAKEVKGHA